MTINSQKMKLDLLAINAHPDDAELSCSGLLVKSVHQGKVVGICDLTQGELGTRGTIETRYAEAATASEIMGTQYRHNLKLRDGFFQIDEATTLKVISEIRKTKPTIVLTNALDDRHPDHGRAAQLVKEACFLSGLAQIKTVDENGHPQEAFRPKHVFHYIQDRWLTPTFVIDITDVMETKLQAIQAYATQFYNPNFTGPKTYISTPHFLEGIVARASAHGKLINVQYGEAYISANPPGIANVFDLL